MNLRIHPFVRDQDEAVWVNIYNRSRREEKDFTPAMVEDLKRWEDAPWVGVRTRLLAELDGAPVARVSAETDRTLAERKGFIGGPEVVPEHRRNSIGTALMVRALASLRAAGMESAEVSTFDDAVSRGFLEPLGFRVVRRFSRMERTLAQVPAGVGEADDVEVVPLGRTDADIALLCSLRNEAFKEHYNYTPGTVGEWKFVMTNIDERGDIACVTVARVAGEPAGFLTYGIDPKDNAYLKRKRGGLWDIGVLKQFRRRGIARRLMIDAMNHLKREGMEDVELGVDETNVTNAKKVYEHLGFAVSRRRLVWLKDLAGFDATQPRP